MTDSAGPENRESLGRRLLPSAGLMLCLALAYSNSLEGEFIFDDLKSIPQNESIRQLLPLSAVLFPEDQGGRTIDARPVVNLSLAINYALGELDVRGYHVLNLAIHMAATLALYGIVRRTLLLPRWPESVGSRATGLAFACALLWGLHPLQTESVTYIIQRAESMSGLFYLLTLYAAIRAHGCPRFPAWYALAILCCALGMATKEVVATAPLVVMLYDRVLLFPSTNEMFRQRWQLYAGLAATWLVLLVMMAAGQGRGATVGFTHGVTPLEYLTTQCWAIPHYLRLAIIPYPLVLDYGNDLVTSPPQVLPGLLVLAAIAAGTLAGFRFQPWIGLLGSCFFLILAPSSSFVPIVTQTVAEHRMYLPLAAVMVFLVIAADWGWRRWQDFRSSLHQTPLPRAVPLAMACGIAGLFGWLTWQRNVDYRTADSIWRDTMSKRPGNTRTHANMADLFLAAGNPEAAVRELDICVQLSPQSAAQRYNRGTVLLMLKRLDAAIYDFSEALKLDPNDPATYHNRGLAWQEMGRHDDALRDFSSALKRDPDLTIAYQSRSISYLALGQRGLAEADAQQFLQRGGKLP